MAQSGMAKLSSKAKSRIYANLEKYARSGMGMEKACQSLLDQPRLSGAERQIYEGTLSGIQQGKSIGDALGGSSSAVSPLEHEVVSASEEGGQLEKGFRHLSAYFIRIDRTRRKILKGLTYPLILIHLAVPVSTLAITVFSGFRMDGSATTINYRDAFLQSGKTMLLVYLIIALCIAGFLFLTKAARTSSGIDRFLGMIPLVGKARRSVAMERFSQVFEIFLLSGKKMSDSLDGAGRASGSGMILHGASKGAGIVAGGDPLATAIYASPQAFPRDFARGIAAAEESGQLDRELGEWGRFYSDSAAEAMDQLAEWTPKLFYWGILLLVAALIIRSALAYFGMIQNLLDFEG
jgi:type II secretory pathway component PulF